MERIKKKKNNGFTLIEVIMTISLIMIVMLPLYQFVKSAEDTTIKAKRKQESGNIGQSILEQISSTNKYYSDEVGKYIKINNDNKKVDIYINKNTSQEAITEYDYKSNILKNQYSVKVTAKKVDKYTYNYSSADAIDNRKKINIYAIDGTANSNIFTNYSSVITLLKGNKMCFGEAEPSDSLYSDKDDLVITVYKNETGEYLYSVYDNANCIGKDISIINSEAINKGASICKLLIYCSETGVKINDGNKMNNSLKDPFDDDITFKIVNKTDKTVYFDIVKGNNVKGKVNVVANNPSSKDESNFAISKYDYSNTKKVAILGDLYQVNVEVLFDNERLFTSKTTKNLLIE